MCNDLLIVEYISSDVLNALAKGEEKSFRDRFCFWFWFKFNNNYNKALKQVRRTFIVFFSVFIFSPASVPHWMPRLYMWSSALSLPLSFFFCAYCFPHIFIIFHQHSFDVQLYLFFSSCIAWVGWMRQAIRRRISIS